MYFNFMLYSSELMIVVFFIISLGATDDFIQQTLNSNIVFAETCQNQACIEEIESLENEIACCVSKQKEIKRQLLTALNENLKKDYIIDSLTQQKIGERFDEFKDKFDSMTMQSLRDIGETEKEDSTFVLTSVRGMYADNLSMIANKTYSGMSKNNTKTALTPEKSR